ncbi:unnamed protein product [Moneuplotes crassus]|uniref:40S ribosomal protein S15a n=1 Tax=Euplotes crassus TaxID=5936 RepID=A0AAD2D506_EUPCR|nr:unnamed protein product [Moneuplotes crassus]|mmetsp:Transcript_25388/g.25123  ORF Transcript_25388/g.25123 Transcript_25388/m.25123 type:complete len:131 (-) Transcript_25388:35-427(-)|eukprot:CAMPEP_0197002984 /NCGR_PEP_ID=MMETSP1380-20130617/7362_1 /TAXON_ID=5936 /ORGANISM="Euplotes crassus, Strain CT5" /LENGTH=130 /DNA_ID=CAMNT_0042421337 /DNA_START=40 /DNA_END=432 /DNA_ORIENTATION=+
MVLMNVLRNVLQSIVNAERIGKRQVMVRPSSKVVVKFLKVMQQHGYINEFEIIDDKRNGKIVIELNGRINKCGVISPRFNLKIKNFEKTLGQILPSRQFGFVVISTNHGIMDHIEARKKHLGGRIIGFFY